jgi:2-C-methyl-D-erythritol 4-phosphate cytidylyltransferase
LTRRILGLVPAAGTGQRMGVDRPKQYLSLGSRTLLERSVECLLADGRVERVLVVVAPGDPRAASLGLPPRCEVRDIGAGSRAASVLAGLTALSEVAGPGDWVLVHDAARPCLEAADLARLIDAVQGDDAGGLLAIPLGDTLKRGRGGRVDATVDRRELWRALTPQFFRLGVLLPAMRARPDPEAFTDESAAVEATGRSPLLVTGSADNIKVTTPADLPLAEAILRRQGRW